METLVHTDAKSLSNTGELDTLDPAKAVKLKKGPENKRHRRLVGQLLWLSSCRRDIAYAIKDLSEYTHDPTEEDVKKGNHLLRYLADTRSEQVFLKQDKHDYFDLETCSDDDSGNCRTSKRSIPGGCTLLNGSVIHTLAKKEGTVADTSTESEF